MPSKSTWDGGLFGSTVGHLQKSSRQAQSSILREPSRNPLPCSRVLPFSKAGIRQRNLMLRNIFLFLLGLLALYVANLVYPPSQPPPPCSFPSSSHDKLRRPGFLINFVRSRKPLVVSHPLSNVTSVGMSDLLAPLSCGAEEDDGEAAAFCVPYAKLSAAAATASIILPDYADHFQNFTYHRTASEEEQGEEEGSSESVSDLYRAIAESKITA